MDGEDSPWLAPSPSSPSAPPSDHLPSGAASDADASTPLEVKLDYNSIIDDIANDDLRDPDFEVEEEAQSEVEDMELDFALTGDDYHMAVEAGDGSRGARSSDAMQIDGQHALSYRNASIAGDGDLMRARPSIEGSFGWRGNSTPVSSVYQHHAPAHCRAMHSSELRIASNGHVVRRPSESSMIDYSATDRNDVHRDGPLAQHAAAARNSIHETERSHTFHGSMRLEAPTSVYGDFRSAERHSTVGDTLRRQSTAVVYNNGHDGERQVFDENKRRHSTISARGHLLDNRIDNNSLLDSRPDNTLANSTDHDTHAEGERRYSAFEPPQFHDGERQSRMSLTTMPLDTTLGELHNGRVSRLTNRLSVRRLQTAFGAERRSCDEKSTSYHDELHREQKTLASNNSTNVNGHNLPGASYRSTLNRERGTSGNNTSRDVDYHESNHTLDVDRHDLNSLNADRHDHSGLPDGSELQSGCATLANDKLQDVGRHDPSYRIELRGEHSALASDPLNVNGHDSSGSGIHGRALPDGAGTSLVPLSIFVHARLNSFDFSSTYTDKPSSATQPTMQLDPDQHPLFDTSSTYINKSPPNTRPAMQLDHDKPPTFGTASSYNKELPSDAGYAMQLDRDHHAHFDITSVPSASSGSASSDSSVFAQANRYQHYTNTWPSAQAPMMSFQPTILEDQRWDATHQDPGDFTLMLPDGPSSRQMEDDFTFTSQAQPMYQPSPQPCPFPSIEPDQQHSTPASWQSPGVHTPIDDGESSDPSDPCYAQLLFRCLLEAPNHTMTLKELYEWVSQHSQKARDPTNRGWQNSVRHNLSMNAAFQRVTQTDSSNGKKGSQWRLTQGAIDRGCVISTTRYRKDPKRKPERKAAAPAIKRQISGAKGGAATRAATRRNQKQEAREQTSGTTSYPRGGSAVRQREALRRGQQMQQHAQRFAQQQLPARFGVGVTGDRRWELTSMPTPMSAGSSLHGSPHPNHSLPMHHPQMAPQPAPPGTVASPYFLSFHGSDNSVSPQAQQAPSFPVEKRPFEFGDPTGNIFSTYELGPIDYNGGRLFGDQDSLQPETPSSFMTEEGGLAMALSAHNSREATSS